VDDPSFLLEGIFFFPSSHRLCHPSILSGPSPGSFELCRFWDPFNGGPPPVPGWDRRPCVQLCKPVNFALEVFCSFFFCIFYLGVCPGEGGFSGEEEEGMSFFISFRRNVFPKGYASPFFFFFTPLPGLFSPGDDIFLVFPFPTEKKTSTLPEFFPKYF